MRKPFLRVLVLVCGLSIALGSVAQTEPLAATSSAARPAHLDAIADHRQGDLALVTPMGKRRTPTMFSERRVKDAEYLGAGCASSGASGRSRREASSPRNPPHRRQRGSGYPPLRERHLEQGWATRTGNGYGRLQMDPAFQRTYGREPLLRKGTANRWTATEQMWVAERAYRSGRGFYPWPNTALSCGLIQPPSCLRRRAGLPLCRSRR